MITMVIDHIGFLFFPHVMWLRVIGRVSFPLFGYLLVRGFRVSGNRQKYLFRLIIIGIISQPIFILFSQGYDINIFGTLILGFLAMWVLDSNLHRYQKILICGVITLITCIVPIDYGFAGVAIIVSFYLIKDYLRLIGAHTVLWVLYMIYESLLQYGNVRLDINRIIVVQLFAILLPVVGMWLRIPLGSPEQTEHIKSGFVEKNFFKKYGWYLFYPVHMLVLVIIYLCIHI